MLHEPCITRRIVTIVDRLATWYPPTQAIEDLLLHMGAYTHAIVGHWTAASPQHAAMAWIDPATLPADALDRFHALGIRVLLSAGRGEAALEHHADPRAYGRALATFAREHGFDGIDLCLDEYHDSDVRALTQWLAVATMSIREQFPEAILCHTARASQFGSGAEWAYVGVNQQVGDHIDFFNIRYFGESTAYDNYDALFCHAPPPAEGTAVDELVHNSIPAEKIVIGKPVAPPDGSAALPGYLAPRAFAELLRRRTKEGAGLGGVCGWTWACDRKVLCGNWSRILAAALGDQR